MQKHSDKTTKMIQEAIAELREDRRLIDDVIEKLEGLIKTPRHRERTGKAPLNRPLAA